MPPPPGSGPRQQTRRQGRYEINAAARPAAGDEIRGTALIVGAGHDVAQGRGGNAMTEHDTRWGNPPDPEAAQHGEQPQERLAGQPRTGELELDANSLANQDRSAYLLAASCLAGSLVSLGLAATEWAEHVDHNRVGRLAILGMIIGALAGLTAAVSVEKPHGRADRIKIVTAWLGLIGFSGLFLLFGGLHGWIPGGPS